MTTGRSVCLGRFLVCCLFILLICSQPAWSAASSQNVEPVSQVVEALRKSTSNSIPLLLDHLAKAELDWQDNNHLFAAFHARMPLNKVAEPGLRRLLTNASPVVQARAAGFLQGVRPLDGETVGILLGQLKTGGHDLRGAAAMALGNATNSAAEVVPELVQTLYRDDRLVAQGAAFGLSRFGDLGASCWPTIAGMFAHQQSEVQIRACWAMSKHVLPPRIAVPILQQKLMTATPKLRYEILSALRIYSREAKPASFLVVDLLHDEFLRLEAIQTIRDINANPEVVLPDLVESFERGPTSDGYLYVAADLLKAYGRAASPALSRLKSCYTNQLRTELERAGELGEMARRKWESLLGAIPSPPNNSPVDKGANDPGGENLKPENDAKSGSPEAQYRYGMTLFQGRTVFRDRRAGIQWLTLSGEAGYVPALSMLGRIYAYGSGTQPDSVKSRQFLTAAAVKNDAAAQLMLGQDFLFGNASTEAKSQGVAWIRKAALQANADGQFMMGVIYLNGLGIERDIDEAVVWFRRAAAQGSKDAKYSLGQIYHTGVAGVGVDQAEAVKWYLEAAKLGQHEAEYYLAAAYINGVGPSPEGKTDAKRLLDLGMPWLKKAAEAGIGDAQNDLGHEEMKGGRYQNALAWFTRALVSGHPRASHNLAKMFGTGVGVTKDVVESYKWHLVAARYGHADSKDTAKALEGMLDRNQIEAGRQRAEMIQLGTMRMLLKPEELARELLRP
jgi:TPR repeat protein/HEAT repeat protein